MNTRPCLAPAILIEPTAVDQAAYAATELRTYLERMTGDLVPIYSGRSFTPRLPDAGGLIDVTVADRPVIRLVSSDSAELGEEGYRLRGDASGITISGGRRGIIYGAYDLLETLGCRFLTPTAEHIPVLGNRLVLPTLDRSYVPRLEYRLHNYCVFTQYPRFAVKRRINGALGGSGRSGIDEQFGGEIRYAWFVHSFNTILDPAVEFEAHPEYFSEVDGERFGGWTQLCLSNPDVRRIAVERVRETLREQPDARLISISQNDWGNPCTCPDCRAIDEIEGSHAGSLLHFVNHIADAVAEEFPLVTVDTLAYQYTRRAPKHVRPRPNVCVRLCTIESCFMHPFESCDDDTRGLPQPDGSVRSFMDDLREWGRVCDRLYIWDYTTGFAHYAMPFPNWDVLQPNIQSFVNNGVRGVFEQANGALGGGADLNELRAYLISALLWNPDTDIVRERNEFLRLYYGEAAPYVRDYIDTITRVVREENIHVGFNDQCDRAYLTDGHLDVYESLLREGFRAVLEAGNALAIGRMHRALLPLRWVRMKNAQMRGEGVDVAEMNQFFEDWRAHGLTRIEEWVSAELTQHALLDEGRWRGVDYYPEGWWLAGPEHL